MCTLDMLHPSTVKRVHPVSIRRKQTIRRRWEAELTYLAFTVTEEIRRRTRELVTLLHPPSSTPPRPCLSSRNYFHKGELNGQPTGREEGWVVEVVVVVGRANQDVAIKEKKDQVWIKEISLSVRLKSSDSQRQRI
ncbi:unnamed protein product [Pleuronectes platessa]|uniref:Uncharacterized protein n=1 Tax=Pleuronectes platessa TaxID=8262 RepID=A0A9N7V2Y4_PLEPL|nr:unnamed protein product [Pleuronectes platessa]